LNTEALLALEDGTLFRGIAIGVDGFAVGEVVFNTSITGYQEILTDPSYARQMVTLTYPHIGNVGVNDEDIESGGLHASGLIVRDVPERLSNWRAQGGLSDYLKDHGVVGIAGIDTRKLTRILRDKGAQRGCIIAGSTLDSERAIAEALAFPGLKGMDLAREVTTSKIYPFHQGSWQLGQGYGEAPAGAYHVVAYDFGIKLNILRLLADRGWRLTGGSPHPPPRNRGKPPRQRRPLQRPVQPGNACVLHAEATQPASQPAAGHGGQQSGHGADAFGQVF